MSDCIYLYRVDKQGSVKVADLGLSSYLYQTVSIYIGLISRERLRSVISDYLGIYTRRSTTGLRIVRTLCLYAGWPPRASGNRSSRQKVTW